MKFKLLKTGLAGLMMSVALLANVANAGLVTYEIKDILDTPSYSVNNSGQTYTGTGFVGMYSSQFAHLLGLEGNGSKTNMQVDISQLLGMNIISAALSFNVLESNEGPSTIRVLGYDSTGALGHLFNPVISDYGIATQNWLAGPSIQSIDITSILNSAVSSNENWLGLHLQSMDNHSWTYTSNNREDRALVRLAVEFESTDVPEPSTLAIFALGMIGLASRRFKKQS